MPKTRLPKLHIERSNLTRLDLGAVSLWFSYETPLVLMAPALGAIVNATCASCSITSAKHRTLLGCKDRPHVSETIFATLTETALGLDWEASFSTAADTMLAAWNDRHTRTGA